MVTAALTMREPRYQTLPHYAPTNNTIKNSVTICLITKYKEIIDIKYQVKQHIIG